MNAPARIASRWIVRLLLAVLVVAGAGLLVVGGLDVGTLQARVDGLAADGTAERYPAARLEFIQRRLIGLGGLILLCAAGLTAWRRTLEGGLLSLFEEAAREWSRTRRMLGAFVREERAHALTLLLLCLVYAVFAWLWIDQPARTDEAQTFITYVTKPWYYVMGRYTTNNHILYSLMAKASCATGGTDLSCLRFPAYLAGIAMVPASYLCLRVHLDAVVGLLGAATVASSAYAIDFATNGRGYTTVALAFLVLLTLAKGLTRKATPLRWLAFVVVAALGFYAVPIMAYPFAMVVAWLGLEWIRDMKGAERRSFLRSLVLAGCALGGLVALLYTPAFIATGFEKVVVNDTVVANRVTSAPSLLTRFGEILVYAYKDWNSGLAPTFALPLGLGVLAGLVVPGGEGRAHRRLAGALVGGLLLVLGVTRAIPPSWIFLFLFPLAVGLGFSGWRVLVGRARGIGQAGTILVSIVIVIANGWSAWAYETLDRPRWYVGYVEAPVMAAELAEHLVPGDRFRGHSVVVPPLLFYLRALGMEDPEAYAWRDPAPGHSLYFVTSRHEGSGEILDRLRADPGVVVEELVRFERSALLRIRAGQPATAPLVVPRSDDPVDQ